MRTRYGRAERRELTFVLTVALTGVLLVTVVAFSPWYSGSPLT